MIKNAKSLMDKCKNLAIKNNNISNEEKVKLFMSIFKARPVYLSRDDRIKAHFTTCFLSLVIHRFLEKKLDEKFTSSQIIEKLREMNFVENVGSEYIPTYTRDDLTDALHEKFGFRTDYEILTKNKLKEILKTLRISKIP